MSEKSCFVSPRLMETISLLWWFEDLTCDCTENSEHSRHILGVHGFSSLTVNQGSTVFNKKTDKQIIVFPLIHTTGGKN